MKKLIFSFLAVTAIFFSVQAQNIKSPSDFLGYELGSNFTRHHKVVEYFNYVSENSSNVILNKYGETNEQRPLYVSFISSEENIKNLENIRTDNLKRTGILEGTSISEIGIVWLSYNVHGNEASSTETAMLTIYKLITEKQDWLENTVVIIDPCINPDGRDRYVNWYNQTKSTPFNTNPDVSEHNEPWPGGRPNHYLFDLNRDWAWATQIETQQRLKVYNKWMPHIHVDFHEQFINNPYYFAPGTEPYHEIITDWQRSFQTEIGKNHAKYFDEKGWRYFTKESFDLFYPSYGDTYPTYMGAIGMTYEQAGHGRAGLGIIIENNTILTLKDRIAHHTTTGLSTIEIASKNTNKMLAEFKKFFNNSNLKNKSYILRGDAEKISKVSKFLQKHEIISYPSEEKIVKAFYYNSNIIKPLKTTINDLVIPTNQPKGKMVKVLFELEAQLSTPITYDITAWNIPLAYGLEGFSSEYELVRNKNLNAKKQPIINEVNKNAYAYINKWNEVSDATFLGDLIEEGFNVRFSSKDFSVDGKQYKKGSLIVMRGENKHIANFDDAIVEIANRLNKKITSASTGFVDSGSDFGSYNVSLIKTKNVAVLAGEGTSSLSFGEIWHFFETQLNFPLNVINTKNLKRTDLSKYQVLILPNGYNATKETLKKFTSFTSGGGTLIAIGSAVNSFADKEGFKLKKKKTEENEKSKENLIPFDKRELENIKNKITGSIFKSTIDASHPLAFGYNDTYYSLKLSSNAYELLETGYNVGYFPENSTNISGYTGVNALKQVPNSLLFGIENKGRGKIIYMVDNPLFRSFWENGKLFFTNAVFFN
ncbi:M14 family metallopeptidase [Lutibacter flavus]|uniref:Zinc carboxypeptidase n=1 Tax=Lutibacter flavus TaxID=691689 RepID=A0A238VVL7_9FLAO|nr:M14 family metallopeptidase [Lutibacter flavus]SNR38392.1 Zinc carboxypeptidase [Lutibacter flavus]